MENDIKYGYNLEFDTIKYEGNVAILTSKETTYYFVPVLRPLEDIEDLYYVSEELIKKNIASHTFVLNNKNQIITKVEDINYALLKVNFVEDYEFTFNDLIAFNNITKLNDSKGKLYRNDWANLWSEKVDYFEYQISEIGKSKRIIINSLSYYIGLAENAIAYVNEVNKKFENNKDINVVLSRKRIYYPNFSINYLNPLYYIFDLDVRDIAEYIKAMYFNDKDIWSEIDNLFKRVTFSPYSIHMLYARLLYPSYYFDLYEKIMNNAEDEEQLVPIIERVEHYEDFLEEIYYYLNNFTPLIPVDWIITKEKL